MMRHTPIVSSTSAGLEADEAKVFFATFDLVLQATRIADRTI